jgi:serine/threonine protein kinase
MAKLPNHPNVISTKTLEDRQMLTIEGADKPQPTSLATYEYAPYGDIQGLVELIEPLGHHEKLCRTFFQHMVEGLDFLHRNGVAHMDVKIENMVLSEDLSLKLIDFDFCVDVSEDAPITGSGTENYRAPEIITKRVQSFEATDIYSAGVSLFGMFFGRLPFIEGHKLGDDDLLSLLHGDSKGEAAFWGMHKEIQEKGDVDVDNVSKEFRELFKE